VSFKRTRCGKSIIDSSIKEGQEEFKDKTIAVSTKKTDFPIIIFWGIALSVCVTIFICRGYGWSNKYGYRTYGVASGAL
jgi:hypothetical protein